MFVRVPLPRESFQKRTCAASRSLFSNSICLPIAALILLLSATPARAQFQSAFVFASDPKGVAVYTRNDATGVLTPVPGSPFPSKEPVDTLALDFKGRYLFTAATSLSKISMFTIDPNTGALQEVPNSPFASIYTDTPRFLVPEITGQTLYVINFYGSSVNVSGVESFQIDSLNQALVPAPSGSMDLPGLAVASATHPSGKAFYVFVNNPVSTIPNTAALLVFSSSTGTFMVDTGPAGVPAACLAMDPQGTRVVTGSGQGSAGALNSYGLNTDGTLNGLSANLVLNQMPSSAALDTLGQYLYVTLFAGPENPSTVHVYSPVILQELFNSPLPSSFASTASWLVDPSAPLIFADQVYQVSPADGSLTSILPANTLAPPAVFSAPPGSQPVEGPVAQLSATAFAFGSLSVGVPSTAQMLTITNTGGQNLSLNTLSISGANASDFSEQDTCHVPNVLPPNQSCSAMLSFTPSTTGVRAASLTITDNAAPSSESVTLSGTGLAQAPAVTLVPGSLTFGSATSPISIGTSASANITVTNSGTAALHISNIALGGANMGDFSLSAPTCSSAVPVSSSCTIAVTFLPLATGLRSATVTLTDDAPDSPQAINVSGTASAAQTQSPAVTIAPATLTFGNSVATVTEGTTASANLTVTNSGTAALHISNIALAGANSSDFSYSAPNCSTAIAANSSCTIAVTFFPLAAGARSATITLTDDAPNSSQTIAVNGYANTAVSVAPAAGGSASASVSAGQPAQYLLQMTPGAGYAGSVALTCSGAPLGAVCQLPMSVSVSNGATAPFTVTVSTSGSALLLPVSNFRHTPPSLRPLSWRSLTLCALVCVFWLVLVRNRNVSGNTRRLAWSGALVCLAVFSLLGASGCGGGATSQLVSTQPPPIVTPSGNYTLIVTATPGAQGSKQLAPQTFQLTLSVN